MKKHTMILSFCMAMLFALLVGGTALAKGGSQKYNVTITNLTYKQILSPPVLINHKNSFKLFEMGEPASDELVALAEGGDTVPLTAMLGTRYDVFNYVAATEGIPPGGSMTMQIRTNRFFRQLSLAGMLVTTNDAFVAINGTRLPLFKKDLTAVAYDAGSEANTQICVDIPGPPCAEDEMNNRVTDGAEGFVFVHNGIHGQGELNAANMDWRNPVAHVVITRVR